MLNKALDQNKITSRTLGIKLQPGCKIKVHGQETRVSEIKNDIIYFSPSIIVPDKKYTIDYCNKTEIDNIDYFEFFGIEE